jgi:hypothetical protein
MRASERIDKHRIGRVLVDQLGRPCSRRLSVVHAKAVAWLCMLRGRGLGGTGCREQRGEDRETRARGRLAATPSAGGHAGKPKAITFMIVALSTGGKQ